MGINDAIADRIIKRSVFLERFKNSEYRKIIPFLRTMKKNLIKEVGAGSISVTLVDKIIEDTRSQIQPLLFDDLEKYSRSELAKTSDILTSSLPIDYSLRLPAPTQLWSIVTSKPFEGELMGGHFDNWADSTKKKVWGIIQDGMAVGKPTDKIVADIMGRGLRGSPIEVSERQIETIVRTSTSHVMSTVRKTVYAENADLIKEEKWLSTLDTRTTPICIQMDGATRELGESQWSNGLYGEPGEVHWNCRSVAVPVTKSWRELGLDVDDLPPTTRASMDGQVPADTKYPDWLARQSKNTIEEVLGQERAKLFKAGEFKIDQFFKDGRLLTLDQLDSLS